MIAETLEKQYITEIADEASLWSANIIKPGSIYPRLWSQAEADPKKKRAACAHSRGARKEGETATLDRHIF